MTADAPEANAPRADTTDTEQAAATDTPQGTAATSVRPEGGGSRALTEWHELDPGARRREWLALVEWVEWLNDRYELSIGGRLPDCWPRHPGLVEELRALKAWREQIYQSDAPSGQAARSWHNDLRGMAAGMAKHYAQGCRARPEHRQVAATDPDMKKQWIDTDSNLGVPGWLLERQWRTTATGEHVISHQDMRRHLDQGTAVTLSTGVAEYVRHDEMWWAAAEDGWLQVTDTDLTRELDNARTRLAELAEAARIHQRLTGH